MVFNRIGHHIHSKDDICLVLPVRRNVRPELSKYFVAWATLSDDLLQIKHPLEWNERGHQPVRYTWHSCGYQ